MFHILKLKNQVDQVLIERERELTSHLMVHSAKPLVPSTQATTPYSKVKTTTNKRHMSVQYLQSILCLTFKLKVPVTHCAGSGFR